MCNFYVDKTLILGARRKLKTGGGQKTEREQFYLGPVAPLKYETLIKTLERQPNKFRCDLNGIYLYTLPRHLPQSLDYICR